MLINNVMDELEERFGRNAKKRISDNTLAYFRRELSRPEIELESTVFPEADESDKNIFNAQICLINWL